MVASTLGFDGAVVESAVSGSSAVVAVAAGGPAVAETPIPYEASSLVLGRALAAVLAGPRPGRLLVDLAGLDVHDAGAGLLAGLGAVGSGADLTGGVAALAGLTAVDLASVREVLAGVDLVGVVPSAERADQLLGLRGITSRRGRAVGRTRRSCWPPTPTSSG